MPAYHQSAQVALLKALPVFHDSLEPLERTPQNLDVLASGLIFGRILSVLDPRFDPSVLERSDGPHKGNIQIIYKELFRYVREHVPELACQAKNIDLKALATSDPQGRNTNLAPIGFHLLAVMVTAALLGPQRSEYIPRIGGTEKSTQAELMRIIQQMQEDGANSQDNELSDSDIDNLFTEEDYIAERDVDLMVEEQNATLKQELDSTHKKLTDYVTRLERLQRNHDELVKAKAKNDLELDELKRQIGEKDGPSLQSLQATITEQLDLIASYEGQIQGLQKKVGNMENDLMRAESKARAVATLQDQVSELKYANAELAKKANTVDRYKSKLEHQQEMEKNLRNLEYERSELQEQLRQLTDDQERHRALKGETELQKMITQSEQHLWDERAKKDQAFHELTVLAEEITRLNTQRVQDEQYIRELQEQVQNGRADSDTNSEDLERIGTGTLGDELADANNEGSGAVPSLELSRLRAENKLLRGSQEEAAQLRVELQDEKSQRSRWQSEYNTLLHKNALVQDQADSLAKKETSEEAQGYLLLRKEWQETSEALKKLSTEKADLEADLADKERELLEVKGEFSASQKESVEAQNELRNTDQLIAQSLRRELEQQRKDSKFAKSERDNVQEQLVKAYISMEGLRKNGGEAKDASEATATDDKKSTDLVEKLRERLIERTEQLKKSQEDLVELDRKYRAIQSGESKSAADQTIKNLRRENTLMATAWHDLTSRLTSNHVVLQRRPATPKSWLNKSRSMVNASATTPRK